MIKYFSTFSGIGAFEYSIKELGLNRDCIGFSEIDTHAIRTYKKHYTNHKNFGDITKIVASDLPNFSILLGGSPCISFSQTGKKKGFDDDNGKLFFDYIKILKEKQPKYFVFENVEGMLSNKEGESFEKIISEFDQAGYFINRKKLNSSKFGSAQNRPRVFFVGQRKDLGKNNFIFPTGSLNNKKYIKEILQKDVDEKYLLTDEQILSRYNSNYHSNKTQLENNTCCCLTASGTQKRIILNQTDEFRKRYYYKKLNNDELKNISGRKLSEIECERLQGFCDDYTNSGISEAQRYKQLGNSININVLKEILKSLDIYIKKSKKI